MATRKAPATLATTICTEARKVTAVWLDALRTDLTKTWRVQKKDTSDADRMNALSALDTLQHKTQALREYLEAKMPRFSEGYPPHLAPLVITHARLILASLEFIGEQNRHGWDDSPQEVRTQALAEARKVKDLATVLLESLEAQS